MRPRAHDLDLCPLIGFQILPFLKIFITDFSGTMKTRKWKVRINKDNDWVYCVYQNRGQGSMELCPMGGFQKIKMHFAQ